MLWLVGHGIGLDSRVNRPIEKGTLAIREGNMPNVTRCHLKAKRTKRRKNNAYSPNGTGMLAATDDAAATATATNTDTERTTTTATVADMAAM